MDSWLRHLHDFAACGIRSESMPRIRELLCASILVLNFARASYSQDESCQHRTVPLSVYDSEGLTIRGLTPSDFEAKYRGQPVKLLSIVPDDRPHRIVILLDASGSMKEMWRPALAAASDVAESQLANTQIASSRSLRGFGSSEVPLRQTVCISSVMLKKITPAKRTLVMSLAN